MSLSTRSNAVLAASSGSIMWEVMANLYDPVTNPTGYYSVGVAENVLMHDELLAHIHDHFRLTSKYLTYNDGASGSKRLKTAMARFLTQHLHPTRPLDPGHLLLTNGVSAAVEHLSWALADAGEGILLGRPYYGTFIADIGLRFGTEVVAVDFQGQDPLGTTCVDAYRRAMTDFTARTGKKVRALLLCHPHNPLGRCYPRSVIIELMRLCQEHRMHFISDEIYALSIWGSTDAGTGFESALSIDTTGIIDADRVHVLWGMSKDFGANGLRLGAIISTNDRVRAGVDSAALYSYVAGPSDHISASVLEDDAFTAAYIHANNEKLAAAYEYTVQLLEQHNIPYMAGTNAGFFIWVDLGTPFLQRHPEAVHVNVSDEVMQRLLKERVFLASGALFGSETPGWFRIVFAHPRDYLAEALRRVVAAIE
ncbi:putative aminotransferase [Aspergillus clavatus NRRL 1]|uniref:Aminotransferase, putative n=1 Tax=Aspergillus clavatus (strain ATCC 1007 / CBS 513.65 / DSM 816 / NCTC 3887 / NRRL 1 / QM 1276 / 107) TaxID=344612 RepID=A1CLW3_ASPCL|nr:aminotransferase, putative [Aspergillus clavatus NRRL 1]EAW09092.1 aminotransferase, putative [Aspergillus clavatus NRRL 1]